MVRILLRRHYVTYLMLVRSDSNAALPDDAVIVVESLGCGVRVQEPKDIALDELLKAKSPFGVGNSTHYIRRLSSRCGSMGR